VRTAVVVRRSSFVVAAIFLVALAVRLANLTYHSLWFDEVMSTFWAAKPAGEIWRVGLALTQDKHPPLYYLLLHGWTALFGPGDAAVRSLGALLGALAVLPVYGIGARLAGRRAGLLAALLLALNPFLVWYSQEARMFMPATTFALWGILGIGYWVLESRCPIPDTQYLIPNTFWSLLLAILGFTAALYTYLFSALLLPVAGAWLLLGWWLNRRVAGAGRRFWLGAVSLAVVGLLFLPLARSAWLVSGGESAPGRAFEGMGSALWRLLQVYTVGWPRWPERTMAWVAAFAATLAVVGLGGYWVLSIRYCRRRYPIPSPQYPIHTQHPGLYLGTWLLLPLLAGGLLLGRDRTIFAETRYFIFLVPALCLAWGWALAWLWTRWRPAGGIGLALVLGVTLAALPADWTPQNRREAWREAAAFVEAHAGPNDAVLIQADYVHLAFERYFQGDRQGSPLRGSLPVYFPFTERLTDPAQVDPPLAGLAAYDAVWLVQSHHQELDPGNLVVGWFGARFPLITEAYPAGIAIHGFAQRYRTAELPAAVPRLTVGAGLVEDPRKGAPAQGEQPQGGQPQGIAPTLVRCIYPPHALRARDDLYHPPSGWVHVTAYWTATAPLTADLFPNVRLVDAAGQVWGEKLDRGGDAIHLWPTSRWLPGEVVRADYDVNLNPRTPPGTYRLVVEMPGAVEQIVCGDVRITNDE
jgi:4-amino-4-deoxy-L-arabinose transferase-like glycosyltransferase